MTPNRKHIHAWQGDVSMSRITLNGLAKASTDISYNAVGRIASQSIKSAESDAPALKRSFAYDVHGWLSSITTSLPWEARPIQRSNVATNFYSAASLLPIEVPLLTMDYTESIYYASGTNPKYNGTPSARSLTLGGRYDYSYDYNDRLLKALYTAPTGSSADFSTEYKYDALSRQTEVKRYGVVDNDGRTETFGVLDHFTIKYDGAQPTSVSSVVTDVDGRSFLGRTGWANGTYMSNSTQRYNAAGRLVYDSSRHLCTVNYNTLGLPTLMSPATTSISSSPRKERVYDAHGNKIRQTDIEVTGSARPQVIADRRYIGSFILNCDTLERVNFGAGYLDSKGKPHFLFTDWQGNVTMTTDSRGRIEQHVGYYPYGEPWREPAGQRLNLYGGKERQSGVLAGDYDFGPRSLTFTTLFNAPDRAAILNPWVSPYSYCMGNPIRFIDPTGDIPNDYESALMSSVVYLDKDKDKKEYTRLMGKLKSEGWEVSSKEIPMPATYLGLDAMMFERQVGDSKEYACAFAGTADPFDYISDAYQLLGCSLQYVAAIANARALHAQLNGFELTFVGHSLAGGLAAAASKATDRVAITFNPAALTEKTIINNSLNMPGNIINFISSRKNKDGFIETIDWLTNIQNFFGLRAPGMNFPVLVEGSSTHSISNIVNALSKKYNKK